MKEKILLLGGSHGQLPAIHEARRRGLYIILCDYLPDNPGRLFADKYYPASTTDPNEILKIARSESIDYIFAYASDPAVETVAFVAEKLGLPANSTEAIQTLSDKEKFRNLLKKQGFECPVFEVYEENEISEIQDINIPLPAIVKPVDSSDTKGVHKVHEIEELRSAALDTVKFSKSGRIIIEEFIDDDIANFHGDGFVVNGKLRFCHLGDLIFTSESAPLKPSSTLYPSRKMKEMVDCVTNEAAKILTLSGFKNGPVNIEARINSKNKIYMMEIGPRSGGSYTPQTIYHSTGFDMVKASFDLLLGDEITIDKTRNQPAICFTIHSNKSGILKEISIPEVLKPFIVEEHLFCKPGDNVKSYDKSGSALGAYVFSFPDMETVESRLHDFYDKVVGGAEVTG